MKCLVRIALLGAIIATIQQGVAGETLPVLKVGSEVYSNVTVTSVTATDLYFTHPKGMGNAKLKSLSPELQKKFNFDPTKSGEVEKRQATADARFRKAVATEQAEINSGKPRTVFVPNVVEEDGDPVVPKIYARSIRGERPPQIIVDQWLTPPPEVLGKFVLVDFWATWCGPCRLSIPHLNELQAKFKDKLVIIGLSNEPDAEIRKFAAKTKLDYSVGTDLQARTMNAIEVKGIPHAILIDPKGIVRYEGTPMYLEAKALEKLIAKYSESD